MADDSIECFPSSRKEAKEAGAKWYFTGGPCPKGHLGLRKVSNGHCLKCSAEASLSWRLRNPEKQIASNRAWINANSEKYRNASRNRSAAWQKANPDRVRANAKVTQHKRRARTLNAEGSHTVADISAIRKAQKDRCGYCRSKLIGKGHVDRIKALSKRGSNARSNLQLLCRPCNQSKGARDPIAFAQSLGKLL